MEGLFPAVGEPMTVQKKWAMMIIGLSVLYLAVTGNRGLWNLYKLRQDKQNLTEQILQLRSEITRYQSEYQAFSKNGSVVEKQAREELNLVKPGEIIYKFTSSEGR